MTHTTVLLAVSKCISVWQ